MRRHDNLPANSFQNTKEANDANQNITPQRCRRADWTGL